jgi:hypothetical protein
MGGTRVGTQRAVYVGVGLICLAILVVGARPRKDQEGKGAAREGSGKKLLVLRMKQPGSPLTLSRISVDDSQDPSMQTIHSNITNNGGRDVVVYTVKHEAVFSQYTGTVSGSVMMIAADGENVMHPGDTRNVEIYGIKYGQMPQNVTLSVDFVEFIDGGRWGPDSLKNGERVDGNRAGAKAERDDLRKALVAGGTEGVIRSLDSIQPEPDQAVTHSPEWLDGFRSGVGWIRERIRSKGKDPSEVETELQRPADLGQHRRR